MHTQSQLARARAAEFHAQADAHRLAAEAKRPSELRTRVGWTLVEVGLRLAATPKRSPAVA
ncbi:hypothetical protein OG562_16205 [Streptomyces sp. NBC_01275]|uniref:hypothetical protein n=1 Tax=Streptomyces sp. NBC_01275 TaxID=2903807 RepID=UPI00224D2CB5|nr:hypothetical protein [Streptomyces sp. NBC_01275]MCX4762491.1 hypothetical protein [Streptomyces sp. NBC_01275]